MQAQENIQRIFVAGLGLRGTRKDDSFLCLLEFFPKEDRWFLARLDAIVDDKNLISILQAILPKHLAVDIPLNLPLCSTCFLKCPGEEICQVQEVLEVRARMQELLESDIAYQQLSPKQYEQERLSSELYDHNRPATIEMKNRTMLSRSFKKRLKKGFIPFWNRTLDFWIWCNYYDALLELFNFSYDSFGPNPPNALFRFHYLRRHFPKPIKLWESNIQIILVEMLKNELIQLEDLKLLGDVDQAPVARLNIVKGLERKLNVFIYDNDLETILTNVRAFESFLLAVVANCTYLGRNKSIEKWANKDSDSFAVPLLN